MAKIPGVYVEISGDSTKLKKDMAQARQIVTESAKGMSNALNNALDSRQISRGTNTLITSLGTLSRSSQTAGQAFKQIGVDLGSLQRITGVTGTQFQQLQSKMLQTSAARMQVDSLRSISRAAGLSNVEIKALGKQFGLSKTQILEVTGATTRAGAAFHSFGTAAKVALASVSVVALAAWGKQILAIADQYTLLESRLRLVTTGAENLAFVEDSLYQISLRTHQAQTDTVQLYTRMAMATKTLGTSQSDLLQITETINKALIVSGASATESGAALIQLSQGLAAGALRGEELNSVFEQTPRLAQAIADGIGVDIGKLREMGKEGKLTADIVTKALISQSEVIEKEFGQMTTTVSQAMTDLRTVFYSLIDDANDASGATDGIVSSIQDLTNIIDQNRDGILSLFAEMINLAGNVVEAFANIGQSIRGARAVADGELSFLEYATSDAEELKQALEGIVPGMKEVDAGLDKLKAKRKDVAESWAFTSEARKAKEDELKSIDESIKALNVEKNTLEATKEKYVDTWQTAKKSVETTTPVVKKHYTAVKTESDKSVKDHAKAEKEKSTATKKEIENRNTYYERYGIAERAQIESLKDSWQIFEEGKVENTRAQGKEIIESTEETTNVMIDEWSNALESIQSSIADMIYEFDFSMDSIIDIFKRMLAEMLAAIIMSGIKDALLGQFDIGNLLGGFGGLFSGKGGGGSGGIAGAGAVSGWGKVGGGLALAGGAYGLYSGAKSLSKGNIGSGALGIGLGGAAAYKGAVTLGMIESGTATGIAKGLASSLGMGSVQTAVQTGTTAAISSTTPAWSGAYLASGGGSTAATGTTAATSSFSGGGIASGIASGLAYALPALAVALVGKGIFDKASRPSAAAEIDEYGITPNMLGQFSSGMAEVQGSILSMVPTLAKFQTAQYNAEQGILALTGSTGTLALQYNESAEAGHQWSTLLKAGSVATYEAAQAADALGQSLGYAEGEINTSSEAYRQEAESVRALNAVMSGAQIATESMGTAVDGLSSAMSRTSRGTESMENSISELGPTATEASGQMSMFGDSVMGLGGVAGAAANKMAEAGATINSALDLAYRFSTWSMPGSESMENHATGGIFTQPARIGSHQFGERGIEGLIPLPDGPDTMTKIIDRLERIEARQSQTIVVNIAGTEVKRTITPMIDAVVASRQTSGVTGRAYI